MLPDLDRQRTRDQLLRTHEQRARQRARDRRRRRAALVVQSGGAAVPGHVRGAGRARAEGTATGGTGDGGGEDLTAMAAGGGRGAGGRGGDGGRGRAGRVGAWDRGLGHQDAVGLEAGGCQGGQHGAVEDCGDGHGVAGLGDADTVVVCGEGG